MTDRGSGEAVAATASLIPAYAKWKVTIYFIISLVVLSALFFIGFSGVQGDGLYYYSTAVSLVWDGDLDLRNQYDHPLPDRPGETVLRGNYFTDAKTGKAFTLFNPGSGLLMAPLLALGRGVNAISGGRHPDPFDSFYQSFACYTSVLLTAAALALLFSILRAHFSIGAAVALPLLFLGGTNWLFYAVFFAGWSHAYAVFLTVFLIWTFLRFLERGNISSGSLFGFAGGLLFTTRNFGLILFVLMGAYAVYSNMKRREKNEAVNRAYGTRKSSGKKFVSWAAVAIFFCLGASPQFFAYSVWHGSPFRTSLQAAADAGKPFGFRESPDFKAMSFGNLHFLYSNLFNGENGLFRFHPLYLIGLAGALLWRPRRRQMRAVLTILLAAAAIFWFADAAYYDNWFNRAAGSGFGHRRFLDFLPFFIFGAAILWEKGRETKWAKPIVCGIYSLLMAGGLVLLYDFLLRKPALYAAKASLSSLYGFLILDWKTPLIGGLSFFFCWSLMRRGPDAERLFWRARAFIGPLLVVFLAPVFLLRASPAWERQKFLDKKGFFLMSELNPYVELSGRWWSFPDNGRRTLLRNKGEIELPAPLERGDRLLLKLTPLSSELDGARLEIKAGGIEIGNAALAPGLQYLDFPVGEEEGGGKKLTIGFAGSLVPFPSTVFYEGRVILKESRDLPFGKIDFPSAETVLAADSAIIEGWALADRSMARVYAVEESGLEGMNGKPGEASKFPKGSKEEKKDDGDKPNMIGEKKSKAKGEEPSRGGEAGKDILAEAEFKSGTRPDIERIYSLYPNIDRAAWKITLDRKKNRAGGESQSPETKILKIRIVAEDEQGQKTILGRRIVVWSGPAV